MNDELQKLATWLDPILKRLSDTERLVLSQNIGRSLVQRTARRITLQRNPDGTPFEPRKKPSIKDRMRRKKGRIKRSMFSRMRTQKHLKALATSNDVAVGFLGRAARIAAIHQYGLSDKLGPKGPTYTYPARELLGLSNDDLLHVKETVIKHLEQG